MSSLSRRIDARVRVMTESVGNYSWKDYTSPDYDRQVAEDALYKTVGPLTQNPKWDSDWEDPNGVLYKKGSPAPTWTQEEIAYAYAGDPSLLESNPTPPRRGTPEEIARYEAKLKSSPKYGKMGGAPLWRLAKMVARKFARPQDFQFIMDLYGNGYVELTKLMQEGYDQSRSAFIPWVTANIRQVMENGVGGTTAGRVNSLGRGVGDGPKGLYALLDVTTGDEARAIANQVKGKFQTEKSYAKHADNHFGEYSSAIYKAAMHLAQLLDAGDADKVEDFKKNTIQGLIDKVEQETNLIPGAATGAGQAINIGDRKSGVGIASMDAESGSEGGGTLGATIPDRPVNVLSSVAPEAINFILKQAMEHDMGEVLRGPRSSKDRRTSKFLTPPEGADKKFASKEAGGKMTANEFRIILRYFGLGPNYYGRGVVRKKLDVPREKMGWWSPGEDPEIEPLPEGGGLWESLWLRNNCPEIRQSEVAAEFTEEAAHFKEIGIPTVRNTVSKVSVDTTLKAGMAKLMVVANIYRDRIYDWEGDSLEESCRKFGIPLLEDFSRVDAEMISEAAEHIAKCYLRVSMGLGPIKLVKD